MTLDAPTFPTLGRAIWQACLAFVLLGAMPALLTGCGEATNPMAADTVEPTADKRLGSEDDPVQPAGDVTLALTVPSYGRWQLSSDDPPLDICADPAVPVQCYWQVMDAKPLGGALSYRYGWDVTDPDDADDPGWYGPPRAGYKSQQTQAMEIWDGVHELTIECWDGQRLLTRVVVHVEGMPVVPRKLVRTVSTGPQ